MQCPNCGKTGFVTIGSKRYCSNCGTQLPVRSGAMSDIRSKQPAAPQTGQPIFNPIAPLPKPAGQMHSQQVAGKGGVLDLRAMEATPTPTPAPSQPVQVPVAPTPPQPTPIPVAPMPEPAPQAPPSVPTTAPEPTPVTVMPPAPTPEPMPAPEPAPSSPQLPPATRQTAVKSPLVSKFPTHPNLVLKPADIAVASAAPEPIIPMPLPQSPALQETIAAAKGNGSRLNPASVVAAGAALAIMGGYIWMQNYPKMAFRTAAHKAGVEATLPSYVPSSYRQDEVSYQTGEVKISFYTPGSRQKLDITQRRTAWDSDSLRENHISPKTDKYLAVQGQGLTIYFYDNNKQVSWVNHGVWYNMTGAEQLSREQILKIAYSL
ncbi:MAG TPA: DUF4367 domain-containing protein [Candidatus Dormibacteraeota bacterium]|nr:DUF4367 domain-containing protein [Candidatus Dormibacteraeota bacterium]